MTRWSQGRVSRGKSLSSAPMSTASVKVMKVGRASEEATPESRRRRSASSMIATLLISRLRPLTPCPIKMHDFAVPI